MSDRIDKSPPDEQAVAQQFKSRMRELDPYMPPAPSFRRIEETVNRPRADRPRQVAPRLQPYFGAPLALVGVAIVAVVILGSGLWGPSRNLGPAGTPSPTTTPSVSLSTPSQPTASGSPAPRVLLSGSVQSVAWSPGGKKLAITEGASGSPSTVAIMGIDGTPIETVNAWDIAWVDDSTYVAISTADPAVTFVGHVGSSARQTIPGSYEALLGNSAGSVALKLQETGNDRYAMWSAAGLSAPRDGVPVVFSADGSLLAVVRYPQACCAGPPSPEPTKAPSPTTLDIVRTSTGESVRVAAEVSWAYGALVAFSPDGGLVAFRMDPKDPASLERVGILDVAIGKVWIVDAGTVGSLSWTDNRHLLIESMSPATSTPAGLPVIVSYAPWGVGDIAVSSSGSVAVAHDGAGQVAIDRAGFQQTIDLPGSRHNLAWSPDGSTLSVVCASDTSQSPAEVVLIRP